MLLSSIHAEKKNTENIDDDEKAREKISTSLKLADEDLKNRTSKTLVVASVSEHEELLNDIYPIPRLYFS